MSAGEADRAILAAIEKVKSLLLQRESDLTAWNSATEASFRLWFGTVSESARKEVGYRIGRERKKVEALKLKNFKAESKSAGDYDADDFAFVNPDRRAGRFESVIHLGPQFSRADDLTRAGTLIHEMSHWYSVQLTEDVQSCKIYRKLNSDRPKTMLDCRVYGVEMAAELAKNDPKMALMNADNFEFFIEDRPAP